MPWLVVSIIFLPVNRCAFTWKKCTLCLSHSVNYISPCFVNDEITVKVSEELFEDLKVAFLDGSIHAAQLPSVDLGEFGTIKSMFIANGPNIKKCYVRKKPVNVI